MLKKMQNHHQKNVLLPIYNNDSLDLKLLLTEILFLLVQGNIRLIGYRDGYIHCDIFVELCSNLCEKNLREYLGLFRPFVGDTATCLIKIYFKQMGLNVFDTCIIYPTVL